jgi:hypothetical protein
MRDEGMHGRDFPLRGYWPGPSLRRLGEMMAEQPKAKPPKGRDELGRITTIGFSDNPMVDPIPLASAGIDKNLAHRAND